MRIDGNRRTTTAAAPPPPSRPLIRGSVSDRTLLSLGANGAEVKRLQQALKRAGAYDGGVNGEFDEATLQAVRAYQRQNGLQVDGIVGQQTWGAMLGKSYPPGTQLLRSASASPPTARASGYSGVSSFDGGGKVSSAGSTTGYVSGQATRINLANVGDGETMRTDAAKAFQAMQSAAAKAGVSLSATSGFRSMAEQQALYQKYLNGTGNLAARPGYSNHQGGVSMDTGGVNGYGTAAYSWLRSNASRYGFKNDVAGEYWHWTYNA